MKLLIKQGTFIDPSQKINAKKDLLIEDGKIKQILKPNSFKGQVDQTLVAKNYIVCPGFVDMHTHLREPGGEYKETIESGTQSASAGGFTSIACMANTDPVNDNAYITQYIKMKASQAACINVYPIGALSKGLKGKELSEIGILKEAGCIAISDDGMPVMNSYLMRKALDYCKHFDLPIISHCEDVNLVGKGMMNEGLHSTLLGLRGNPIASEEIMVARDIALAQLTKGHVHLAHMSTKAAVRLIADAKKRNIRVSAEVTPHHLFLTDDNVASYDTNFKMAPPLRNKIDTKALKQALKEDIIDALATDHAPHSPLDKKVEFEHAAHGVVGFETALPITLKLVEEKTLTLSKLIEKWTIAPAKLLKINKGTLKKGADADITIFDPQKKVTIDANKLKSKSKNTPFHGWKCKGQVKYTIVGGKIVYQN